MEKDEIFHTVEPPDDIACQNCRHKLSSVKFGTGMIERYKYANCAVYEDGVQDKPEKILWDKAKCEYFKPERM